MPRTQDTAVATRNTPLTQLPPDAPLVPVSARDAQRLASGTDRPKPDHIGVPNLTNYVRKNDLTNFARKHDLTDLYRKHDLTDFFRRR